MSTLSRRKRVPVSLFRSTPAASRARHDTAFVPFVRHSFFCLPTLALSTPTTMKVTLHRYTAVATWRWLQAPEDDVCGICQNAYESTCPDDGCKYPGEGCPIGTWLPCRFTTWSTRSLEPDVAQLKQHEAETAKGPRVAEERDHKSKPKEDLLTPNPQQ